MCTRLKALWHGAAVWQTGAAVAFWLAAWQLAAMAIGSPVLLASPLQSLKVLAELLPTAAFWRTVATSGLRILLGFLLAVVCGTLLAACGWRWRAVRVLLGPPLRLVQSMPVASFVILALLWVHSSNLSVVVSFTHVLPVIYAAVLGGIGSTDRQLLEMARVYRLPLWRRLRCIWLPGVFPSLCQGCAAAMGMCWKSGVSAEVIGQPRGSLGDMLYRAKLTLSTGEVFAWTLVIVVGSALCTRALLWGLERARRALCGEEAR